MRLYNAMVELRNACSVSLPMYQAKVDMFGSGNPAEDFFFGPNQRTFTLLLPLPVVCRPSDASIPFAYTDGLGEVARVRMAWRCALCAHAPDHNNAPMLAFRHLPPLFGSLTT